jgi:hypothetical protein
MLDIPAEHQYPETLNSHDWPLGPFRAPCLQNKHPPMLEMIFVVSYKTKLHRHSQFAKHRLQDHIPWRQLKRGFQCGKE